MLPACRKSRRLTRRSRGSWTAVLDLFSRDWRDSAKRLLALERRRKIRDPSRLLRTLLIYLLGKSLRETAALACGIGVGQLSDTALLKRLRKATLWLHWLALDLLRHTGPQLDKPDWLRSFQVQCVDATVVCKPGSKGTDWRLHFVWGLFDLGFQQFLVTGREVAEGLRNFAVARGDLLIGDRGYAQLKGMIYVTKHGGDFLVRLGSRSVSLYDPLAGTKVNLLRELESLAGDEVYDRRLVVRDPEGNAANIRVCARRLTRQEARKAQQALKRKAKRKGEPVSEEVLSFQEYLAVATSVSSARLSTEQVLKTYRLRWQIEIAIKRLKSIIGLSRLPSRDQESGRAWLYGKLVLALVIQILLNRGQVLELGAITDEGNESRVSRRRGNLWREMKMTVEVVSALILWSIDLKQIMSRLRRKRHVLEERPRQRVPQLENLH